MDWSVCIVCGKCDGELVCPVEKNHQTAGERYNAFLENVNGFRELNKMPVNLAIPINVTSDDLLLNCGKWHKQCHIRFATSKLERAKRRYRSSTSSEECLERKSRRTSRDKPSNDCSINSCIFCSKGDGLLHNCSTLTLDKTVREMATELQDTELLSRIAGGDLVAIEAKYHNNCLTGFKNRYRKTKSQQKAASADSCDEILDSRVFAELTCYIECEVEEGVYMFKLSDLHLLYVERLTVLGCPKTINKTRLKMKLIDHFYPECQEQSDGKNILLVFNEGMQNILKNAINTKDYDQEALLMAKVSREIRREISEGEFFKFSGSFPPQCEDSSVPFSLKSLISMLLYGPNIKGQTMRNSRACLSICQLILFNLKGKTRGSANTRHDKIREPPLPLYVGIEIHSHTRSKKLINVLCELGLCINYKRILEIQDQLTSALCKRYRTNDLVCPPDIQNDTFTVGALDNIDHNLSSTSAKGSFHGTSISIFQFPQTNSTCCREPITMYTEQCKDTSSLSESFSIVPNVSCNVNSLKVPAKRMDVVNGKLDKELRKEVKWFDVCIPLLSKEKLEKGEFVSWSAHHAACQPGEQLQAGISTLLPLFQEKAATIAMVKHGMTVVAKIIAKCNPGQIPVIAVDQPLFALAKYVQWYWPDTHGEDMYTVMLGGLHIEMALWRMVGDIVESSGWTEALAEADVATPGVADSFIYAAHLTKTRRAHQITALALAKLQREACQETTGQVSDEALDFWREDMKKTSPTFNFWDFVLRLETLVLVFVRSHRERNFSLYVSVLEQLVPFFFILDHTNYARWLSVHIRDMKSLPESHKEDIQKYWVFPKTGNKFSAIPIDQAHEQNNKIIKDAGGAIGLTENLNALKRWMVSGPELVRLLHEFKSNSPIEGSNDSHEQGRASQEAFKVSVNNLHLVIKTMGNPFLEDCGDLIRLDNHDCADSSIKTAMGSIEKTATSQYNEFVQTVLVDRVKPIQDPIKKNNMPLFKRPPTVTKSKIKENLKDLREDYSLFGQLFIVSQTRESNLEEFFSHENHPWPPSLSQHGRLRLPSAKSQLLECLDHPVQKEQPHCDAKVFDGAAVVHTLPKGDSKTFGDYSQHIFIPWTIRQLRSCNRIDIVWGTYKENSLKEATREHRGLGTRKKVYRQTKMPINFMSFLRDSQNKIDLFTLLSEDVAIHQYPDGKMVCITAGESVIVNGSDAGMPDTDQEEADTRMCLHVKDLLQKGCESVLIITVDTDVIIIILGIFCYLKDIAPSCKIWVEFGTGKNLKYFNINSIYQSIGEEGARSLPFLHAFTGCDTTSQFAGKGKKTAWKALKAFPQIMETLITPSERPFTPIDVHSKEFKQLEKYTCILYDSTTEVESVNELRQELLTQGKNLKLMQNLPPTQASLIQHMNRSLYQASIWLTSLKSVQDSPSPENFGSTFSANKWQPLWTTLPEMSQCCRELIKCGCKATPLCSRKCLCRTNQLKCTSLCACRGDC